MIGISRLYSDSPPVLSTTCLTAGYADRLYEVLEGIHKTFRCAPLVIVMFPGLIQALLLLLLERRPSCSHDDREGVMVVVRPRSPVWLGRLLPL